MIEDCGDALFSEVRTRAVQPLGQQPYTLLGVHADHRREPKTLLLVGFGIANSQANEVHELCRQRGWVAKDDGQGLDQWRHMQRRLSSKQPDDFRTNGAREVLRAPPQT